MFLNLDASHPICLSLSTFDLDWYFWIDLSSRNEDCIDTWTAYDADDNRSLIGTFGSNKCQL